MVERQFLEFVTSGSVLHKLQLPLKFWHELLPQREPDTDIHEKLNDVNIFLSA